MRRLLYGLISLVIIVASAFAWRARSAYRIESIPIRLQNQATDSIVRKYQDRAVSDLQNRLQVFAGLPAWSIKLPEVERIVSDNPLVAKPFLRRWLSGAIHLEFEAEDLVFLTSTSDGKLTALTRSGKKIALIKGEIPNLPLLTTDASDKKGEGFRKALELFEVLPESGSFSRSSLAELNYSAQFGLQARVIGAHGKIIIGTNGFEDRIQRTTKVLDYLLEHELQWRVIDTNFSKKIVVRLRKSP